MSRDFAAAAQPIVLPVAERTVHASPYVWRIPSTIPPREWVYGRQLLRGSLSVVVAPGATGKTALMIGTSLALVTGQSFLGKEVWGGAKRVWLWNLEDSGRWRAASRPQLFTGTSPLRMSAAGCTSIAGWMAQS